MKVAPFVMFALITHLGKYNKSRYMYTSVLQCG